jgi:hypothetical protein
MGMTSMMTDDSYIMFVLQIQMDKTLDHKNAAFFSCLVRGVIT